MITTEDGESVPAAGRAEHWVDPREVDGVLTGRPLSSFPPASVSATTRCIAQNPPATRPLRRR